MPDWINTFVDFLQSVLDDLPDFVLPLVMVLGATLAALIAHRFAFNAILRWTEGHISVAASLTRKARRPTRLIAVLLALVISLPLVSLPNEWQHTFQHAALIMMIIFVGWTALILTNEFAERSAARNRFDVDDNLSARKHVTQVRVLQRAVNVIVILFTAGAVLLTFEGVQEYGVSLFASAGAAGLVLGFAARPVLANLIAGIQIALTQPIRLDDVVIVEDEWGWIEEIYATYVVVRIWDLRRMVVPLSYFIEKPFQNWTRESANIIGAVTWHMDYTVPVEKVRQKVTELVEASPYWNGDVVNLQVVDTDKDTMTLRGLMSAATSPQAWDLRCEIREKLLAWLQAEYPEALPRLRGELSLTGTRDKQDLEKTDQQSAA